MLIGIVKTKTARSNLVYFSKLLISRVSKLLKALLIKYNARKVLGIIDKNCPISKPCGRVGINSPVILSAMKASFINNSSG